MLNGDIDSYIATFTKLLRMAGYQETEHGSLALFKQGLPGGLNIHIINNLTTPPDTLRGWIECYNPTLFFLPPLIHPSYPRNNPSHLPLHVFLHTTAVILAYIAVLHLFLFHWTLAQLLILLPIKLP
jgi:hypothetical protein